jgi:hypothetical protein
VGIVIAYELEIKTEVRGLGYHSGYIDWLRAGDYDRSKKAEITQWV